MNFWCFTPDVFDLSVALFQDFLANHINEVVARGQNVLLGHTVEKLFHQ